MQKALKLFMVLAVVLLAADAFGVEADAIVGQWYTAEQKSIVEIYSCEKSYCGKIVWLKEPKNEDGSEKLDIHNPDPEQRKRKIIGMNLFYGFQYKKDNQWTNGKIYDPESGKTYSCKLKINKNELKVRGYIGISLLGRTEIWIRK